MCILYNAFGKISSKRLYKYINFILQEENYRRKLKKKSEEYQTCGTDVTAPKYVIIFYNKKENKNENKL